MSAGDSERALARMVDKREELGADGFGAYAFLALGILAHQAPEVVQFILDRADDAMNRRGLPGTGGR